MNKLSALYTAMKHMKDQKNMSGTAEGEILFGTTTLAELSMTSSCDEGKCVRRKEIRFGEEVILMEHSGTSEGCCTEKRHGHHGHHHGLRGKAGGHCCGSKFGKAMLMLKMLDKLTYEEQNDGNQLLSLEMEISDLPEELQAHLMHKRSKLAAHMAAKKDGNFNGCCEESQDHETGDCHFGHGCCSAHGDKVRAWLEQNGVCDIDLETLEMGTHSMKLLLDPNGKPISMAISFKATVALKGGEKKDLHIRMNGKML